VRLDRELGVVSYEAHSRGNAAPEANARLDQAIENIVRRDAELRSVDAAIEVARRHVEQAQAAEHAKAERARATEIRAVIGRLKTAGQTVDDALEVLVEVGAQLHAEIDSLHRLGWDHPNHAMVMTHGERVLRTAIAKTMWARIIERLPPNERTTFAHVISQWEIMFERRLGEQEAA
jgi:hypothetical protein